MWRGSPCGIMRCRAGAARATVFLIIAQGSYLVGISGPRRGHPGDIVSEEMRTKPDSAWFAHHLRRALVSLYDPSVLRNSPLLGLFDVQQRGNAVPALQRFEPEMVFVSAGFDAHVADDMSHVHLVNDDYVWISERIVEVAEASAAGRIVSALEGGYELYSLARCVEIHLRVLAGLQ